jgi:hypothetical protein
MTLPDVPLLNFLVPEVRGEKMLAESAKNFLATIFIALGEF